MKNITTLPEIEILSGNSKLLSATMKQIDSIKIIQKLSVPSLCEIDFSTYEKQMSSAASASALDSATEKLIPGSEITIKIKGEVTPLFYGTVTATEYSYASDGSSSIKVRAFDPLFKLCKNQKIYTYIHSSVVDIAKELIKGHKIIPKNSAIPVWERIVQYNETDNDFLARVAQRSGHYYFFYENSVQISNLDVKEPFCELQIGDNLLECNIDANSMYSLKSVYSSGWDPFMGEIHEETVSDSNSGSSVNYTFSDDVKQFAGERKLVDIAIRNSSEAKTVSQAEMDRCKAGEININGVAGGDSALYPGTCILIDGVAREFCGKYNLTEVTHILNNRYGYITKFSTIPPDFRSKDQGTNATFGTVTDINDPEKIGRVKVLLDTYMENETDWMNVVLPSSGHSKGVVMLPDAEDRVLVLFLNNDPARGVVIGGISTQSGESHKWGIEDGKVEQFHFISPKGQTISLDDKNKKIRMENIEGSYVEIGPKKVMVHSKTDLTIEAPGQTITICGKNIDFKKG